MKRVRFPVRVKRGSSVVSIYKTPTRGYALFTVIHYDAEGRRSGAFAGVRSQELKRLEWDNIRLREGHIEITSASSKTRIRRLIPIQRNLEAWLLPFARDCGPVTPFANLALRFAKLARKTGVRWKKNGLRHSFISSWHASKRFIKRVEEINSPEYRATHKTPLVKLAPLPSCAQFLNVIESVFSGMAKAIIHNSDYQSVEECQSAIDRYFEERNQHFKEHPMRAGKKIWGEERVPAVFNESNNCKDPRYQNRTH